MHELSAQVGGAGPMEAAASLILAYFCFSGVLLASGITIRVLFLLSVSQCLKEISPRNRKMEPEQVWLCLIPVFGFVWEIIMFLRVAESLNDEYYDRALRGDGDYGKTLGIVFIVMIGVVISAPFALIPFIMYWVKIREYTKVLRENPNERPYDDEYDDRPRRRSRHRDRDDDEEDDRPRRRPREDDYEDDRPSRRPR